MYNYVQEQEQGLWSIVTQISSSMNKNTPQPSNYKPVAKGGTS